MTDWDRVGFVMASQPRFRVLVELRKSPATPKKLSEKLDLPISHISLALRELGDATLVECLNPTRRKGRLYGPTAAGAAVLDEIARLARAGKA